MAKRTKSTFRRMPITGPAEIEPNPAPKAPEPAAELDLPAILAAIEAGECPAEVLIDLRGACLRQIARLTELAGELHRAGQPAPAKPPLPMDGPPPGKHPPQQQRGEAMRAAPEVAGRQPARRAPSADAQVAAAKAAAAKFATGGTSDTSARPTAAQIAVADEITATYGRLGHDAIEQATKANAEWEALFAKGGQTLMPRQRYVAASVRLWTEAQERERQAKANESAGAAELERHRQNARFYIAPPLPAEPPSYFGGKAK